MRHPSLAHDPSDLIGGEWVGLAGDALVSTNPARPAEIIWQGSPSIAHVGAALDAAREALGSWSRWARERRFAVLRRYAELCTARRDAIAGLISDETGKAAWDAQQEASALPGKVDITLDAHGPLTRVTDFEIPLSPTRVGWTRFRPHGVMAVIAPYNFPAHLANGHIVPALAMGNTVVLKPSEKTPATGQLLVELLHEALEAEGAPDGVVNLVQGGPATAVALTTDDRVDGILFTGSWAVGRKILEANLDRPGRIVALEMGGNNPAVVLPDADVRQAAVECVRSAYVTTGQRCTCTRRLIVHEAIAGRIIPAIGKAASNLIVGDPRGEFPVFMGPLISAEARAAAMRAQEAMLRGGAEFLVEPSAPDSPEGGAYITPSLARVDGFVASDAGGLEADAGCDVEVFAPMLRYCVVSSLEEAIEQAGATRYGLAASIFTRDRVAAERFVHEVRAGCINVNTGTAGASSKLPFGGLGLSGNHRPAGSFSVDYCVYPVAGMEESSDAAPLPPGMRFEESWVE
jgi:succinylglutamic semialdehyde dehydrogenase